MLEIKQYVLFVWLNGVKRKQRDRKMAETRECDVIIIGGGATGAGIARDCALRGLQVTLLERHDIATGATGRNHGLLHSGARYAVTDSESARECINENRILRRIARHCVEPTNGLFITLPEDDLAWQRTFINACQQAGIETRRCRQQRRCVLNPPSIRPCLAPYRSPMAPSIRFA
jgi:glycerol-3-phosphate dehydrogenase